MEGRALRLEMRSGSKSLPLC